MLAAGEPGRASYHPPLLRAWLPLGRTRCTRCSLSWGFFISHVEPLPQEGCFLVLEEATALGRRGHRTSAVKNPCELQEREDGGRLGRLWPTSIEAFIFQVQCEHGLASPRYIPILLTVGEPGTSRQVKSQIWCLSTF